MRVKRARLLIALGVVAALPAVGGAQMNQQKFQSEGRIDAIFARSGAVEAAYGFTVPAGIYVRTGLVAGIGAGRYGVEGRTDAIARFSMDPFRQSRWAPYAGAGLSGRYRSERDGGSLESKGRWRLAHWKDGFPPLSWGSGEGRASG